MLLVVFPALSQTNVTTESAEPNLKGRLVLLNIGGWNTMLQPWFSNEPDVVNTISRTSFDVLTLEGVWTAKAASDILSNPLVRAKYRYSYYAPATQKAESCPSFIPRSFMEDYINCFMTDGVDTHTIEQPVHAADPNCTILGVNIEFTDQPCLACLQATMQELPDSTSPFTAIDRCYAGQGAKFSHGGSPGRLV